MGMRPDIEVFERLLLLGPEVIKKKKPPDSLPSRRRQKATDLRATDLAHPRPQKNEVSQFLRTLG